MRREQDRLLDILDAADDVARFITGLSENGFASSDLVQSAVRHKLIVIGEAATRLSEELRERHREIPWDQMRGFRNIAVHEYFRVDATTVWTISTRQLPQLRSQIAAILARDDTEPG